MTTLVEAVRTRSLEARRAGAPIAGLYSAVLGTLDTRSKAEAGATLGDNDVVAVLQGFLKGINETIAALESRTGADEALAKAHTEKKAIMDLLPTRMDEDALRVYFTAAKAAGAANMGAAMALIKAERFGQYDGKIASNVARNVFG